MNSADEPSLLIVVPTLNSHALLPRLLTSLQQQSWPHWRLLFIDGPSGPEHRRWLDQCCRSEPRCRWVVQDPSQPGIFGAMNQGFALAAPLDWLLFWGSDDWAAEPQCLEAAITAIQAVDSTPDLLVCQGRYADTDTHALGRPTRFQPAGLLNTARYRRALWLGSTPPPSGHPVRPRRPLSQIRLRPGLPPLCRPRLLPPAQSPVRSLGAVSGS